MHAWPISWAGTFDTANASKPRLRQRNRDVRLGAGVADGELLGLHQTLVALRAETHQQFSERHDSLHEGTSPVLTSSESSCRPPSSPFVAAHVIPQERDGRIQVLAMQGLDDLTMPFLAFAGRLIDLRNLWKNAWSRSQIDASGARPLASTSAR